MDFVLSLTLCYRGPDEEGGGGREGGEGICLPSLQNQKGVFVEGATECYIFQARPRFPSSFFWSSSFGLMLYSLAGLTQCLLFDSHLCQWTASSRGVEVVPSPHCNILNTHA